MADETLMAALRQGKDAWNEWRVTHANIRPDLSNASLRGLDLVEADLSGVDLHKADLRGTILSGAILTGANLAGANCSVPQLRAAHEHAQLAIVASRFGPCVWRVYPATLVNDARSGGHGAGRDAKQRLFSCQI
jgi:hypothetical protein